jgi:hypothetical protein
MSMKSFSYHELMSGKIDRTKLETLANAGKLNEETLARIGHVSRFYQCVSKACPDPNLKISDVLTGDELQNSGMLMRAPRSANARSSARMPPQMARAALF